MRSMLAEWDGTTVLPNSWYLCQTKEWAQFRYWYWNEIIAPAVCCDGYIVKCAYCGWKGPRTKEKYFCLDHVIPYVEAPHLAFDIENITISCNCCNKKKGNLSLGEFLND